MVNQTWLISPRPGLVEQRKSLPARDRPSVRIGAAAVIARSPLLNVILCLRKGVEPSRRILRKKRER